MKTQRNDNWQPMVKTSVGLAMITTIHARAKELAGFVRRRRMMPPQTIHTITAQRTADGCKR
jgi:hypothetical protein